MRAFVMGASPAHDPEHTRKVLRELKADPARDLFVAADGGVRGWLECGIRPQLAVGDWDSFGRGRAERQVLEQLHHVTLPKAKDRSDLFYAASTVVRAGATRLFAFGVTGARPDHHWASVQDLGRLAAGEAGKLEEVSAYGAEGEYRFLSTGIPSFRRAFKRARTLSVFALEGPVRGVTLKGCEYPLRNATLEPGSRGLSNRARAGACEVRLKAGSLLVLLPAS